MSKQQKSKIVYEKLAQKISDPITGRDRCLYKHGNKLFTKHMRKCPSDDKPNILWKRFYSQQYGGEVEQSQILVQDEMLTNKWFNQPIDSYECWFYSVTNSLLYSSLAIYFKSCHTSEKSQEISKDTDTQSCPLPDVNTLLNALYSEQRVNVKTTDFGIAKKPLLILSSWYTHLMMSRYLRAMNLSYTIVQCTPISPDIKYNTNCILLTPPKLSLSDMLGRYVKCLPKIEGYKVDSGCLIGTGSNFLAHYFSAIIENGTHFLLEPYTLLKFRYDWSKINDQSKEFVISSINNKMREKGFVVNFQDIYLSHVVFVNEQWLLTEECQL